MSKRVIGTIGMIGASILVGMIVFGVRTTGVEERMGVRNSVYAVLATALLIAVLIDAVHHVLAHTSDLGAAATVAQPTWVSLDPACADSASFDATCELLPELRLAARLGAELMGEAPSMRYEHSPAA